jgi:O-methyltransferase involved in polyketide biosynthesis
VIGPAPSNLSYVATDFEEDDLRSVLTQNGYDFGQRSFVIMEGVTMYLQEAAVRETLELIASQAPGTSVVFDFVSSALIAMTKQINLERLPPAARAFAERFLHLVRDEPWEFGFPLGGESDYIERFGLSVPEILVIGGEPSARRYLTRADGSQVGGETMARQPRPEGRAAQAQAEAMAYRITEAVVPSRH